MELLPETENEWLETDGLGAFASGTSSGVRTRRYHNVLMIAKNPPSGRVILVNGFDVWVETPHGTFPISTQAYVNNVFWPEGFLLSRSFVCSHWPTWIYDLGQSLQVKQELFVHDGIQGTAIRWQVIGSTSGVKLHVKPFLSARDYHSVHHENDDMNLETRIQNGGVVWPWLIGPFVEAWFNVNGKNPKTADEAKTRFLYPLEAHLEKSGLGHISEIADASSPYQPRGCPFQAWSLSEFIRIHKLIEGLL